MILLLDNYDSFVHNLARMVGELGLERRVVRNDRITLDEIAAIAPTHLIVSPGPKTPAEAGLSIAAIRRFGERISVLGVCLGHQAIGRVYGGRVVRAKRPMHGKTSPIHHDGEGIFSGIPNPFEATRYHSLVIDPDTVPSVLEVQARSDEGEIMAVRHRRLAVVGVQFHPEAVLTQHGHRLLSNFLGEGVS